LVFVRDFLLTGLVHAPTRTSGGYSAGCLAGHRLVLSSGQIKYNAYRSLPVEETAAAQGCLQYLENYRERSRRRLPNDCPKEKSRFISVAAGLSGSVCATAHKYPGTMHIPGAFKGLYNQLASAF